MLGKQNRSNVNLDTKLFSSREKPAGDVINCIFQKKCFSIGIHVSSSIDQMHRNCNSLKARSETLCVNLILNLGGMDFSV